MFAELRVGRERLGQDLDCDRTIESRVPARIDFTHAPDARAEEDFVWAEAGAGPEGQWRVPGLYPSNASAPLNR
jgi:hypothetical protein